MIHKGTKSPLSELYIDPVIVIMSGSWSLILLIAITRL
jgi:hypothetical protein